MATTTLLIIPVKLTTTVVCGWKQFIYLVREVNYWIWQWILESISSTVNVRIFCTNVILAAFSTVHVTRKAAETTFVRKTHAQKRWWNWHLTTATAAAATTTSVCVRKCKTNNCHMIYGPENNFLCKYVAPHLTLYSSIHLFDVYVENPIFCKRVSLNQP